MKKVAEGERPRYRWAILFACFFAYVAFAFALQQGPPLIPHFIEEFEISHAEAGLVMSAVLVPGVFLSLPAGLFVERYGVKRIGFASLVCIVLGCFITSTADSFIMLLGGRLILGVGGSLITPTTPAIIAQWFTSQELGKAMGIYGIHIPFATVVAFPSTSFFTLAYGWRFPFYVSLALGITATAIFSVVVKESPFAERKNVSGVRFAIGNIEIWKVGLLWLFFSAAGLSFTTWAPKLFETFKGMPKVYASFLGSLFMWAPILCVPIYGWISDRAGRRKPFAVVGCLLMTLTFVVLAYTSNPTLAVSILALGVTSAMVPPIFSVLPAEILGPSLASVGFGITGICSNMGSALAQPLIGFLLDVTESYSYCFLGMATLSLVGAIVACTFKTK